MDTRRAESINTKRINTRGNTRRSNTIDKYRKKHKEEIPAG